MSDDSKHHENKQSQKAAESMASHSIHGNDIRGNGEAVDVVCSPLQTRQDNEQAGGPCTKFV